jgi:hypothetical protein
MAPAYQPILQLFGPLVAEFASESTGAEPTYGPLLSVMEELDQAGYNFLSPLYGPHRQQVLTAETQLATILAPYSSSLPNTAAGSCLIDLEGVLVRSVPHS